MLIQASVLAYTRVLLVAVFSPSFRESARQYLEHRHSVDWRKRSAVGFRTHLRDKQMWALIPTSLHCKSPVETIRAFWYLHVTYDTIIPAITLAELKD